MTLTAQEFRERLASRRKVVDVDLGDLGTIRLRAFSAGQAQRFQAEVRDAANAGEDPEAVAFSMIAQSWVGEDGELWMPEQEGVELARSLDPEAYNTLATRVLELNGMTPTAVEDAAKNSEASRNESTPTGSPENSENPT